jgi:superfamily I DNA/RNA helicase
MLALEKARRLAAEGMEVLLTCYNRPLADYMKQSAGTCERLTIANYHTLCWEMAKAAGHPFPDTSVADPPPGFWEKTLPEALLAALDKLPRRFHAIVVDEGQDFLDSWWDPLMLSLADVKGGIVYVFHDDNQKLYRRTSAFPAGLFEITLQENLRNTRRISALTERFYQGPPMRAIGPEGQDVDRIAIHDASEIERQVSRALHHLIKNNGVAPADIAVLIGSGRACPLRKGQRIGAFETTTDQAAEPSKVLLETVRRFKGLERPVIVLTGIDDLPATEETALLYVGLSRARVHLVIVATEATMERVAGSGADVKGGRCTPDLGEGQCSP